jgi:hypothetical protein
MTAISQVSDSTKGFSSVITVIGAFWSAPGIPNPIRDENMLFEQGIGAVGCATDRIARIMKSREACKSDLVQFTREIKDLREDYDTVLASSFIAIDLLRAGAQAQISRMFQMHDPELNEIVNQSLLND